MVVPLIGGVHPVKRGPEYLLECGEVDINN
jgi:hypothetical protein